MSKRKASEASRGSSAKRSSSSSAALALPFDLAASNPKAIASALLSLLPDGATKQHNGAKNLLKAFDLIRAELDHNANKLVRKAEASGATKDFFFLDEQVKMPEDVFLHMLEYLPKPFLVHKASLICKPWLSATKTPCLWSELDIDAGLPKEMNMSTLLKLMARSQFSCLKTLILPGKARFTKASPPKNLAQRCPLLEEIDVGYARYAVDPSDEQLVALPNHFPHLRKIRFNMWKVTNVGISSLSESMADRLLDLRIKGYTSLNYADRTLSDSTLIQVANVCPNLERFDYWISLQHHVPENDALSEIGVMALLRSCTKLKHLSLIDTKKVGLAAFEFIANANGSHLRHLDVEGVPSLFGHNAGRVRSRLEEHIEETIIRRMAMMITVELLDALISPGPSRQQAEVHFQSIPLVERVQGLLNVLFLPNIQEGHVLMATVLLRRDIASLGVQQTSTVLLKSLVEPLLQLFQKLASASCRRQVGYCLAEVCCSLSLSEEGQAVFETVLATIAPKCRNADTVSLRLLANLADRVPSFMGQTNVTEIFQSAIATLQIFLRPDALEALTEAICNVAVATEVKFSLVVSQRKVTVDSASPAAQLGTCTLPSILTMMESILQEEDSLQKCLEHLAHAAGTCPSLLAGDLNVFLALVGTSLKLATTCSELALPALQVLASLCAVGFVKRHILTTNAPMQSLILGDVLRVCAELCVNGVDDDVAEWASEPATIMDDVPTWEGDDTATYAEELLGSFLQSLGGKQALPVVLPMVETLLVNKEWKHQRAALSILEQCLYAAPVTFLSHLPITVQTAVRLASSDNMRVQFQAVILLGALCGADIRGVDIRTQYGARILQELVIMVQHPCTKISAVACLTLVSYCRGGDIVKDRASLVVPYLKDLLMALVTGPLSQDNGAVKIRAIGAVACLAEAAGEAFVPFYGDVMPGLLGCTQLPSPSYEMSRLRGAAMEAATIVGQGVSESNRDLFVGDAETIMKLAMKILQADDSSATAIPMDELLSACARIASVMGEEYAPFVSVVLPHLLTRVAAPPDVQLSEGDEADLEATKRGDTDMDDGTECMTVSLPGKGITKIIVNTTKIMEKAQAARAIYEHAAALGPAFGPYAETTLATLFPLVDFRYSPEVRATVAQAISAVFEAACAHGETCGMEVPQKYLPMLAQSISKQIVEEDPSDPEVMFALADSLSDVFYFVYRTLDQPNGRRALASFDTTIAKSTVQCVVKAMVSCLARRAELIRILEGDDGALSGEDEKEEYIRALEGEQEVLTPLVDTVGYTIKFLREKCLPVFESEVVPVLGPYLKAGSIADVRGRYAAICLFDDCVEHCGSAAAAKYAPCLMEGALLGMDDTANGQDMDLKQVSVYGIAQIARYAPSATVMPHAERLVSMLVDISNVPKDATDHVAIVENGISALASLALIGNAPLKKMDSAKKCLIMSIFLDQLPLSFDESEAKICHAGLCDLVENGQVLMATETERLLRIIGDIFTCVSEGEDIASPETQSRLAGILFQMQRDVSPDRMQDAFGSLTEDSQRCINSVMDEFRLQSGANRVSP